MINEYFCRHFWFGVWLLGVVPYTCVIADEGNIRYARKGIGADFSTAMAHQLAWVLSEGQEK
jgi:hypothetical protein